MTDESSMAPEPVDPFDSNSPDLEGCTDTRHCHRKRSARQEDARTPEGRMKACHRPAGWGTNHLGTGGCKFHAGNAPSSVAAAQAEVARKAVQTLGVPVDVGPADALLQEVQRTAGHVAWLAHVIAGLERDELVWGLAEEVIEPDITSKDGDTIIAQVTGKMKADFSVWYKMYAQERRHLANVCKLALDAGVNERIVSMYEQVGDTFVTMIENVLNAIGLTDEQRRAVPAAVVTELTRLTGDVG